MVKYIKYEIKGTYKVILGIIAVVLIISTVLYNYMDKGKTSFMLGSFMLMFGAFLVTFLYIVNSFKKELYEDRGYLTFTLPLTGKQIVGAKMIVALMWFILLGIIGTLYIFFMIMKMTKPGVVLGEVVMEFSSLNSIGFLREILIIFISNFIIWIMTLTLVYFSMTLSRVTFRSRKIGGMWFIIFLVLNIIVGYIGVKIVQVFPYYLDLTTFKLVNQSIVERYLEFSSFEYMSFNGSSMIMSGGGKSFINIASTIYMIIITIFAFLSTGYILENKVDL
ncbi:hypothetical protein [Anaerosalibacter massiliensis]|uniref:ABC-2 family transporter protein n=1 Tax=Anaerosalibacter massiliensis TaxID=1347392 RepID=A0A9X2MKC6_9FIRM|nr:hypothetical protein [Anaerosalibacter massiliensis]MCR2044650.1 hypothetical protein [Anaerosalibacter massiliensis]